MNFFGLVCGLSGAVGLAWLGLVAPNLSNIITKEPTPSLPVIVTTWAAECFQQGTEEGHLDHHL